MSGTSPGLSKHERHGGVKLREWSFADLQSSASKAHRQYCGTGRTGIEKLLELRQSAINRDSFYLYKSPMSWAARPRFALMERE